MKITSCVPLAGPGVIARNGALVAVTDGRGPDPDPLLNALADVSASSGDGGGLAVTMTAEVGDMEMRVDGVPCARDHFNDPAARACRQCGIGLDQPPPRSP